mgnify:CR=1 FL=1
MHHLINFKNFADAQIDLRRPVTLLIGRNGAGKSNVIEGVELLAQLAQGRSVHQISDVGRGSGSTFEIRGGLKSCVRRDHATYDQLDALLGEQAFSLGFEVHGTKRHVSYKVTVETSLKSRIAHEALQWGDRMVFETVTDVSGDNPEILSVRYDNFARGGKKPIRQFTADCSVLSRYESLPVSDNAAANEVAKAVRSIRGHLQRSYVFDPNPKLMRDYENIGQSELFRDGSNLASVLYGLEQTARVVEKTGGEKSAVQVVPNAQQARETLNRISERLRHLPEDAFIGFEFEETRLGEVGLGFRYSKESVLSSRQMSDGTLRALAILTALETVPQQSRLVIEEIDNGIHPARVKVLMDAVWEAATRRKLNVLATTHNPATLDQLDHAQIQSVVLCFHDSAIGASRLLPIPELPAAESMLEQGRLGELMTQQVLERHVQPGFAEKRAERGLAWLKKIQQSQVKAPT